MKTDSPHQSSFSGISANIIAMACYLSVCLFRTAGLIIVLLLLFTEKYSGFVKFHASQSVLLWLARWVVSIFAELPARGLDVSSNFTFLNLFRWSGNLVLSILNAGIEIAFMVFCVVAAVHAYKWRRWQVPGLGILALRLGKSFGSGAAYDGEGDVPPSMQPKGSPQAGGENSGAPESHGSPHGEPPGSNGQAGQPVLPGEPPPVQPPPTEDATPSTNSNEEPEQ